MLTVKVNVEDLKKQLEAHKKEITRKLTILVQNYSYNLAMESVYATPKGDISKYASFYRTRPVDTLNQYGYRLTKAPGHARGGWQMTFNQIPSQKYTGIADTEGNFMESRFDQQKEKFKLGDTIFVTNYVPYVSNDNFWQSGWDSLENNRSSQTNGQGIVEPVKIAMKAWAQDLQRMFDRI